MQSDDSRFETEIQRLVADAQYENHPLQLALAELSQRYRDNLSSLERLTSISDGYHQALREHNESLAQRYRKQIRQLEKIVRISDHYQKMLHEMNMSLQVASTHDPLTGLPNRRLMLERLSAQTALSQRSKVPFSIAVADVDHFKTINDNFGHQTGDVVLNHIGRILGAALRPYDVCARWGGEEFLVLLPDTDGAEALEIANRLRVSLHEEELTELPGHHKLSMSVGVAQYNDGELFDETIKHADFALYDAKRQGRNCCILADSSNQKESTGTVEIGRTS
ncbi:MAG TPA: biofilm regulation diguanylate cyclase SiaD [Abditibacteriaceae bacterium]|jgi:diguanylate cyclase (GGDEF)-like protein